MRIAPGWKPRAGGGFRFGGRGIRARIATETMGNHVMTDPATPSVTRVVIAFILDLLVSFFVIGYAIALLAGETTETGFSLTGLPAVIAIALWITYMAAMPRHGGRLFQKLLGAHRTKDPGT